MLQNLWAVCGADGFKRASVVVATCLLGCLAGVTHAQSTSQTTTLSLAAQAGQKLFFDTNLSGSKKMSCATCHDPTNHYAQSASNKQPVQFGGPNLTSPGFRAVPTLTYKLYNPPYSDSAVNPDGVSTNAPG